MFILAPAAGCARSFVLPNLSLAGRRMFPVRGTQDISWPPCNSSYLFSTLFGDNYSIASFEGFRAHLKC